MQLTFDGLIYVPDDEERVDAWGATYELQDFTNVKEKIGKKKIRTAIDCGSHVGVWTRHLSTYAKTIHAFEPVPQHIECWKHNTKDLKHNDITLHEIALANKEREVPEYLQLDEKNKKVKFVRIPKFEEVPYPVVMEPNLVIEYYSR